MPDTTTTTEKTQAQAQAEPPLTRAMQTYRAARQVSTPLVAITTPDPASTIQELTRAARTKKNPAPPVIAWDIVRGCRAITAEAYSALAYMCFPPEELSNIPQDPEAFRAEVTARAAMLTNPTEMLDKARSTPAYTVIVMLNAHRFIGESPDVAQAVWNLRDPFKSSNPAMRQLIMLAPEIKLPAEISQDVLIIDEPLPSEEELAAIAESILNAASIDPAPALLADTVSATTGLSAFSAEQAIAMSVFYDAPSKSKKLDTAQVWEKKRRTIEQTPGLNVWRGNEDFSAIGGSDNVKSFYSRYLEKNSPRVVLWLDEIEKMFGGAAGDTSGVSKEMLGKILTWMQDEEVTGSIFIGPPGSGKSMMAKAIGNHARIPTISCNVADMKGSLVGESNRQLAQALKVVSAIAGRKGKVLAVATCNGIDGMPPELLGRFKLPTFFFDLPNDQERETIWKLYQKKYKLAPQAFPPSQGWAGRDIQKCAENAAALDWTLQEAASYVVNISQSSGTKIEQLRRQCSGNYISASYPGPYIYRPASTPAQDDLTPNLTRTIDLQ